MINLANKKFKNKNLSYLNLSIFDFNTNYKFDCVSANGFIEYISLNDIKNFLKISSKLLN